MDNNNFWSSISDIIQKGFDKIGQQKLINYAKQFTNRQLLFKRYTKDEQFGCAAGGTLHVIATILAGAEARTNRISESGGCFQREQQRAKAQCKIIEEWAKSVGCWVDNVDRVSSLMCKNQTLWVTEYNGLKAQRAHSLGQSEASPWDYVLA